MNNALRSLAALLAACVALVLCAGCDRFPRDPGSSLARALDRGTLRVGVSAASPWVVRRDDGTAGGLEGTLVTEFANELGVRIEWRWDSAEHNFESLGAYELDVVIAGLSKKNPWSERAGMTLAYYTSTDVVAVGPESGKPDDLRGVAVAVRRASPLNKKLRDRGATPVELDDPRRGEPPVACARWEARGRGLIPCGIELGSHGHVMAVPLGENAMLMRLESFLLERADDERIEGMLWEWSER